VQAAVDTLTRPHAIVIAHRLSTIERVDRIVVLDAGKSSSRVRSELLAREVLRQAAPDPVSAAAPVAG
jgi:ABC-type multidrug transport system fused ATPase/permease subunit